MAHHSKCLLNHFTVKWNSFLEKKGKLSKMYAFIQRYRVHNTWNIKSNEKNGEILPSRESRVQCLPDPVCTEARTIWMKWPPSGEWSLARPADPIQDHLALS